MQRRSFLKNFAALAGSLPFTAGITPTTAFAANENNCASENEGQGILGLSQGFFEIRHRHQFFIPLALLAHPPAQGYIARCSAPLKGQTDFNGLKNRTNSDGSPLDLREHAHTLSFTQDQLIKLGQGRHLTIDLPQFGHLFYFVADDRTLANLQNLREGK